MRCLLLCVVLVLGFAFSAPTVAAEENPAKTITAFHKDLLSTLVSLSGQADQARYEALQSVLDRTFNYKTMIKTVTGRHWRKASPKHQEEVLSAFRAVSIATYADQYAGLTDGKFETIGSREGPRGLQLVETRLSTTSRSVGLTYVLREEDGFWKIIDVLLDGGKISELARKASEYAAPLKQGGLTELAQSLRKQKNLLLEN